MILKLIKNGYIYREVNAKGPYLLLYIQKHLELFAFIPLYTFIVIF